MKFKAYTLHKLLKLSLLACLSVTAVANGNEEESVSVKLSLLSLGSTLRNLHFDTADGRQTTTVTNAARTASFQYVGKPELVFYRTDSTTDGEVETNIPLAAIDLRNHSGNLLLLFSPTGKQDRMRIFPLPESEGDFPNGSWRLFNLTRSALAVAAKEAEPVMIPSRELRTLTIQSDQARTRRVEIAIYREDGWEMIYRSLWSHRPDSRTLVFITPQGDNDERIRVNRFTDSAN